MMYFEDEINELVENLIKQANKVYQETQASEYEQKFLEEQEIILETALKEEQLEIVQEWAGELLTLEANRQKWLYQAGMRDAVKLIKYLKVIT